MVIFKSRKVNNDHTTLERARLALKTFTIFQDFQNWHGVCNKRSQFFLTTITTKTYTAMKKTDTNTNNNSNKVDIRVLLQRIVDRRKRRLNGTGE